MKLMWTLTPVPSCAPRYLMICRDCERRESYAHAQPLQGMGQTHADAAGHTVDIFDTWVA